MADIRSLPTPDKPDSSQPKGKIKPGDTVCLNGQHMKMTVENVTKGIAKCCWHDDGKSAMFEHYPIIMLSLADFGDEEEK